MAELFGVDSDTVGLHLKNIYSSKELNKTGTTEDYSVVRLEENGTKVLENNALVALTLMIAESRPQEKVIIVKVIVNLINRRN